MPSSPQAPSPLRQDGHLVEALLLFLKQLTAHARWVFAVLLLLYAVSGIRTIQPQETAVAFVRLNHHPVACTKACV